ncbi:MAG: FlgD immunoglobulin-like domain containing protein [Ignavibacteria bacterium]|jgi:glucuronoarabinoxylan endo-1,4-beta-xylanase
MKKELLNYLKKRHHLFVLPTFWLLQIMFFSQVYGQSISVSGRITASRIPVQDALVTFVNNTDSTIQFSALTDSGGNYEVGVVTSVASDPSVPSKFSLGQSYPNPFSSKTAIPYGLNKESTVQVIIYDILGRVVRKFDVGQQSVGTHNILWDGCNNLGQRVASGVYFYRLNADGESQVKKMIFNQNGNGSVVLPNTYSLTKNESLSKANNVQGSTFTVRVQNTSTTTPLIVPVELENVVIQNDTTVNFSVTYVPVADIDFDSLHQIIRGFGAANIVGWRPDMTDSEIETAFGTGDGQLGFSILRLRISPDSTQWSVNVSSAKKVYDKGVLVFASPWTPPASMKTNNSTVGGELSESSYADYAAYLNRFTEYMADNGVPLYAVSLQNEPDITVTYESCDWTSSQFVKFLQENTSAIGTKIIAPESYHFDHDLSDPILNDSLACANLDIVGGHIYGGGLASYPLAEEKGKEVWMTEHLTESNHSANIWSFAMDVGLEMNSVMKANMNAYVWWYIVRYYGPIGDGEESTTYPDENFSAKGEVTKKGYVMSQFSRFIRPGYYRVESSVSPSSSSIKVTAYKDPASSKIVIVAVNSGTSEAEPVFRIQNGIMTITFTPYTTSESKNCEQGDKFDVTGDNFTYTLEPSSITTFVSD